MKRYVRRRYHVPVAAQDLAVGRLWLAGTLGIEVTEEGSTVVVTAYFTDPPPPGSAPEALHDLGARPGGSETIEDADWLAPWRQAAQPLAVGKRWLLDPREVLDDPLEPPAPFPPARGKRGAPARPSRAPSDRGRILLRLPARSAFGTGGHESTRLVLEILERMDLREKQVLDVGAGTGVLGFAALALGAGSVVGFDLDPAAALLAALNARLNRAAPLLFAGPLAAIRSGTRFDLVLANVIPEEIAPELRRLAGCLAPGGRAVFSGILRERARGALAALRVAGFVRRRSRFAGEWAAYLCEMA
jgi:ribosomal protein L11 methyltransferase